MILVNTNEYNRMIAAVPSVGPTTSVALTTTTEPATTKVEPTTTTTEPTTCLLYTSDAADE